MLMTDIMLKGNDKTFGMLLQPCTFHPFPTPKTTLQGKLNKRPGIF